MKILLYNTKVHFLSQKEMTILGSLNVNATNSALIFGNFDTPSSIKISVSSNSASPLIFGCVYNSAEYNIASVAPNDFGKKIDLEIPSGATNFFFKGNGNYDIVFLSTTEFVSIASVTAQSKYTGGRLLADFSLPEDALNLSGDLFVRVDDSTGLMSGKDKYNITDGSTHLRDRIPVGIITKFSFNPTKSKVYVQHTTDETYTPVDGDTVITMEIFKEVKQ